MNFIILLHMAEYLRTLILLLSFFLYKQLQFINTEVFVAFYELGWTTFLAILVKIICCWSGLTERKFLTWKRFKRVLRRQNINFSLFGFDFNF